MKDELISRETAIRQTMGKLDYVDTIFDKPTESEIVYMLRSLPSVPAVPLDKLCDALSKHLGNPPCPCGYDMKGTSCNPDWTKKECWYYCLTNWMEEQNAR